MQRFFSLPPPILNFQFPHNILPLPAVIHTHRSNAETGDVPEVNPCPKEICKQYEIYIFFLCSPPIIICFVFM